MCVGAERQRRRYDLNVDTLDMHADKNTFHRFDKYGFMLFTSSTACMRDHGHWQQVLQFKIISVGSLESGIWSFSSLFTMVPPKWVPVTRMEESSLC